MRDFMLTPTVRAHSLAGRLFVPVLMLVAAALVYTLASSVAPVVRGRVASVIDSSSLVR